MAAADQEYAVSGDDVYRIGSSATVAKITYEGTERLSITQSVGGTKRYTALARYTRNGDDGRASVQARFVQDMTPRGSFEDEVDEDPDFLTVLNQPFAIQLDAATLRDLRTLHKKVPFEASSPLGGDAVLRGFLRPAPGGQIDGAQVVAVKFEAEGVMTGTLPTKGSTARMSGQMRMEGTAYYSSSTAPAARARRDPDDRRPAGNRTRKTAYRCTSSTGARYAPTRRLKRPYQLHLQRVPKRNLLQHRKRRERKMILMAVDQHFDAALHAAGGCDVFRELAREIFVRIA